ncbi:hypothetical protein TRIP_C90131 [Candidatus Zixiibacteriota bacterium]|nr:hypothetical protein TRIP_C90131 [candidate division Zixibacteria bacterium]
MARLETLKKLETTLENFLRQAVEAETARLEHFQSIDTLDDIARDSMKGRFINNRLGNWFARNKGLLDIKDMKEFEISSIANLLNEIQSGMDRSDTETDKLADEIEHWKEQGIVPKRRLILKGKAESDQPNITEKFLEMLKKEAEFLEYEPNKGEHLLTILDDVLKSAEAKEDPMYIHLAASMIYFMRMNGYKVGPFVKRLKEIEQAKSGGSHAG